MNRILAASIAILLIAAQPAALLAAAPAAAPNSQQFEAQISVRQARIATLTRNIVSLDDEIQRRVTKVVDELQNVGDSRDSGSRVARIRADVIDFLRKQITDYSRRRAQLRAEMDNVRRVIPNETLASDIAKIDARIDLRIQQIVALGGSFAQHQDFDRFSTSGSDWWGGTEFRENEDWRQNRRATQRTSQQQGRLRSAIDENISRLEFSNRSLNARLPRLQGAAAERVQADIARNNALIATLRGKGVTLLTTTARPQRALSLREAQAIAARLREVAVEIRRDQTRLTGFYNDLNAERYQLALLEGQRRGTAPRP